MSATAACDRVLVISHACILAINRNVFRRLVAEGWSVHLVIPTWMRAGDTTLESEPDTDGDPVIHRLTLNGTFSRAWTYQGLRQLLDDIRPGLVLVDNDVGSRLSIQVGLWARTHNASVVCQSCENYPRRILQDVMRRRLRRAVNTALVRVLTLAAQRVVHHVFVISDEGRRLMDAVGFKGRNSLIPLGFDPTLFRVDSIQRNKVRKRLGLHAVTVAYFGRVIPEKGVHHLIEALARLKDFPWQLLLDRFALYQNDYGQRIRDQVRQLGLDSRVREFDASHAEMPGYMNAADIVVVPSFSPLPEQYGRVVAEAMACGRLVIVSTNGALSEVLGGCGMVFREGRIDELVHCLSSALASQDLRESFGTLASRRAEEHLGINTQSKLMGDVFRRMNVHPSAQAAIVG